MKRLKYYANLYKLYKKSQQTKKILAIVFLAIFVLSIFVMDIDFDMGMIMFLMIIPAIAVLIVYLVMRSRAIKSISRFTD